MTFSTSFIDWRTDSSPWGAGLSDVSAADQATITGYLLQIAGTTAGATLLGSYSSTNKLQIGEGASDHASALTNGTFRLSINLSQVTYEVNTTGQWVVSPDVINIAHELAHMDGSHPFPGSADPSGLASYLNASGSDYDGYQITEQNIVAVDLSLAAYKQVSYNSGADGTLISTHGFTLSQSYSDGHTVDAVRVGRALSIGEVLDTSNSPNGNAMSKDLVFGSLFNDTITTGAGNDYAYASNGNDSIDGGVGDDHLFGEGGSDTIYGGNGDDVIRGGGAPGLSATADAGNDELHGGDGDDSITGDTGQDSISGDDNNDKINGGTGNDTAQGGNGSDYILAHAGSDSIIGGQGNDLIDVRPFGDSKDEIITVKFAHGDGHDYIVTDPVNQITFTGSTFEIGPSEPTVRIFLPDDTPSSIHFHSNVLADLATQPGDDFIYKTGWFGLTDAAGDTIYLGGFHQFTAQFDGDMKPIYGYSADINYEFEFGLGGTSFTLQDLILDGETGLTTYAADGNLSDYNQALSNWPGADLPPASPSTTPSTLAGGAGDDILYGGDAADTLLAGAGNNVLLGGAGNDTYLWSRGDGAASIYDSGGASDTGDTLVFGDVDSTNVTFGVSGHDIVLTIAPTTPGGSDGGTVTLQNLIFVADAAAKTVDQVEFHDSVTLTAAQILSTVEAQLTPGDDYFFGTSGADTIAGGTGNDILDGAGGNDIYQWSPGDGADTIDDGAFGGTDNLHLIGVAPTEIALSASGDDLLVTVTPGGGGAGSIDLVSALNASDQTGVETISFDSGVVLNATEVTALLSGTTAAYGTASNDSVTATSGADLELGGDGGDKLDGGGGNDTLDGGSGADTLLGGANDDVLIGGAGNDSIAAADGNDTLIGGAGTDIMGGSRGADLFVFGAGFGHDGVADFTPGSDHISFQGVGFSSFADVQAHAVQSGLNVIITDAAGDILQLNFVALTNLHSADFIFT